MRASTRRCVGIVSALVCSITVALPGSSHAVPFNSGGVTPSGGIVVRGNTGILTGWGAAGSLSLPASLQGVPVASISMGNGWALASTLTGKIVTWGADSAIARAVPSSIDIATLKQLSASGTSAAAALTWDGHVTTWFGGNASTASAWLDTSALTGIDAIALGQQEPYGVALTKVGTVKAWGVDSGTGNVSSSVPTSLTNVVDIAACDDTALALTADGGVHGWGSDTNGLVSDAPAADGGLQQVTSIACAGNTAIALRRNGSITEWGDTSGVNGVPASLTAAIASGASLRSIDASSGGIVAWNGGNSVWAWGSPTLTGATVPTRVTNSQISEFAPGSDGVYALTPAVFALDKPIITGMAAPGHSLAAPFSHFSGGGVPSGQWYRDGIPIDGSSTPATDTTGVYRVTASDVGRKLTFRTTAVDPNNPAAAPVVAESEPVTVGRASSTLAVTPQPASYGRASSVTVRVVSSVGASGPVSLSLDGTRAGTAPLSHGTATFRLPAKLAAGPHMVGANYAGNSVTGGASGWATLNVAKATSHTKITLPKKAHKGGKVKVTIKVHTSGGRATGTVAVRIGKAKGYGSVVHGKAVVRMTVARTPHKQKVVAIYSGDNNVRGSRAHARLTVR